MIAVSFIILAILNTGLLKHPWIFDNAQTIHYRNFAKYMPHCINGPATPPPFCGCYGIFDMDNDCDVDMEDVAVFERLMR